MKKPSSAARVVSILSLLLLLPRASHGQVEPEAQLSYTGEQAPSEAAEFLSAPASLTVEDVPLTEALIRLQDNSGVPLAYSPSLLRGENSVSCLCRGMTVGGALRTLLRGTAFEFEVAARQIVIRQKALPTVRLASTGLGGGPTWTPERIEVSHTLERPTPVRPQGTVTGLVTDAESGSGLSDAQVSIAALEIGGLS